MKAELNGMKLEGTPEEILKFMELRDKNNAQKKINVDDLFKRPYHERPYEAKWVIDLIK